MKEERTCTITSIIYRNEDNGYTVATVEDEELQYTVVGNLPRALVGSHFRLVGSFINHPKFGEQFSLGI